MIRLVDETGRQTDLRAKIQNYTDDEGNPMIRFSIGPKNGEGIAKTAWIVVRAKHAEHFAQQLQQQATNAQKKRPNKEA